MSPESDQEKLGIGPKEFKERPLGSAVNIALGLRCALRPAKRPGSFTKAWLGVVCGMREPTNVRVTTGRKV